MPTEQFLVAPLSIDSSVNIMKLEILKGRLGGRLVKKHFTRHFRRLAIMERFYNVPVGGGIPQGL
jgi:hypothetical protein